MTFILYFLTGIAAGIIGGLLGTGGCALMMPVVRFGFNFDPAFAVGTTLFAVVFTAGAGAYKHLRMGNVDRKTALYVGISGIFGVIIGSLVFGYLIHYKSIIDLILGFAFLLVSIRMAYEGIFLRGKHELSGSQIPGKKTNQGILGACVGVLTGIIGLGGGYALVPSFIYFFRAPTKIAIGTSMASFIWIAFLGAILKLFQQVVNIQAAIILGIGAVIGAIYGAGLVARFQSATLKALFGILFFYVSLKYILIYFGIRI
jgi:uncharacterized membrane protein YfcA